MVIACWLVWDAWFCTHLQPASTAAPDQGLTLQRGAPRQRTTEREGKNGAEKKGDVNAQKEQVKKGQRERIW